MTSRRRKLYWAIGLVLTPLALCIAALAVTVGLSIAGVIPDSALASGPRTPTPPRATGTPALFAADPRPSVQSGDSWELEIVGADRLPTVDGHLAPAGHAWLLVRVRARMIDRNYQNKSRTLYNRSFHLRLDGRDVPADEAAGSAFDRGYASGSFGNTLGTSVKYRQSATRTVIFAVPVGAERFELDLQGYKARTLGFTLRAPSAPAATPAAPATTTPAPK
jgi:hypothetical protein